MHTLRWPVDCVWAAHPLRVSACLCASVLTSAVANYDSVVDGAKIVKTAIDTWGRVDIVINKSEAKHSEVARAAL